jgi:tetratricopeptide (TPR) repeat protein
MRSIPFALCLAIAFTLVANQVAFAEEHDQSLQSLLAEARAAQSRRDFSEAAESYRKAVALEPGIPQLWANLGLMDHEIGKHAEAAKSFQQAIRLNPALFVPQLFLGLEYMQTGNAESALPHLEAAARLNPDDLQAALALGRVDEMLSRHDRAAASVLRAAHLAPRNGDAWLQLGTALLEQVENDARLMTSAWSSSPWVNLRAAETLADEGKLGPAEHTLLLNAGSPLSLPCARAELGIVFLRETKYAEAQKQFDLEAKGSTPCGLASLGLAIAALLQDNPRLALQRLTSIASADPDFLRSSLPLFRSTLSPAQVQSLLDLARQQHASESPSVDIASLLQHALDASSPPLPASFDDETAARTAPNGVSAERLYAEGRYAQCDQLLKTESKTSAQSQLLLLASCAFYTGDFTTASMAGERLKASPATAVQGLYWESKADQKLAVAALARAGEIDPNSPGLHLLIGNAFRQQRHWAEAEAEYRKAVALDPASRDARLALAITLFTELKTDEAFHIAQALLADKPGDPEANLLAAEILVQEHKFSEAEPYLANCKTIDPELAPRVHVLLGRVYAETNRPADAIAEYKLGIGIDADGSVHYQLARLYQKVGNQSAAAEEMQVSKQLRQKWDNQARIDLGQPVAGSELQ